MHNKKSVSYLAQELNIGELHLLEVTNDNAKESVHQLFVFR